MKKQIWFTSDTHYAHKNICRGVSEWTGEDRTRDFETLEEMNYQIVKSINDHVKQDDILYHLGDWSFGGIENIWNFRKQIICEEIHLIFGNHDQHIKKNKVLPNCIQVYRGEFEYNYIDGIQDELSFTRPQAVAQEIFSTTQGYLELEIDKQVFVLSHYPMEEWLEMDRRGGIMLHGHCHHALDSSETNQIYRRMDVGIDWEEFRPFSLEDILYKMRNRPLKKHNALLK